MKCIMCDTTLYTGAKHEWSITHNDEEIRVCGRCYILVKILESLGEEKPNGDIK